MLWEDPMTNIGFSLEQPDKSVQKLQPRIFKMPLRLGCEYPEEWGNAEPNSTIRR